MRRRARMLVHFFGQDVRRIDTRRTRSDDPATWIFLMTAPPTLAR